MLRGQIHEAIISYFKGKSESLEKYLNELTDKQFGKLSDYIISPSKYLKLPQDEWDTTSLYSIICFRGVNSRLAPYVICDKIELEQPGITDFWPTSNIDNVRVGIVAYNDIIIKIL